MSKNPIYSAGIRTQDLSDTSHLPLPLDQSSYPLTKLLVPNFANAFLEF